MEVCLYEENFDIFVLYLDDILVFFKIIDDYIERLDIVFLKFKYYGLKLKLFKCYFFRR